MAEGEGEGERGERGREGERGRGREEGGERRGQGKEGGERKGDGVERDRGSEERGREGIEREEGEREKAERGEVVEEVSGRSGIFGKGVQVQVGYCHSTHCYIMLHVTDALHVTDISPTLSVSLKKVVMGGADRFQCQQFFFFTAVQF